MPVAVAISRIFDSAPTRIGTISPFSAASMAPASAVRSAGCATAVVTGSRLRHLASSASYFPVPVRSMGSSCRDSARQLNRRARFLQEKRQQNRERDTEKEGPKRFLVVFEPHLGDAAGDLEQHPAEYRCQQGAEREVQEIDDSGGGAARLRRIGLLDHRVGQHRGAG